eukprot:SAG11_NODE_3533_length_2385_cov_37.379537_2_plen_321_part_00
MLAQTGGVTAAEGDSNRPGQRKEISTSTDTNDTRVTASTPRPSTSTTVPNDRNVDHLEPNRDRVAENLRNLHVESGKSSEIGIVIPALHDDTFGFVLGISNGTIAPISTTVTLKSRLGQVGLDSTGTDGRNPTLFKAIDPVGGKEAIMGAMATSLVEPMASDARSGNLSPPVHIDTTAMPTTELTGTPPSDIFLLRDTVRLLDADGEDEQGVWAPAKYNLATDIHDTFGFLPPEILFSPTTHEDSDTATMFIPHVMVNQLKRLEYRGDVAALIRTSAAMRGLELVPRGNSWEWTGSDASASLVPGIEGIIRRARPTRPPI